MALPRLQAAARLFHVLPLLVILFDEFVLSSRAQLDPFMMVGALIFGALLCGVFLFLVPPPQVRAQRKAGFVAPYRISLGNDGVRVEHPRQDNLFRWGGLHHVSKTEDRLFLYTTPGCALILPKALLCGRGRIPPLGRGIKASFGRGSIFKLK